MWEGYYEQFPGYKEQIFSVLGEMAAWCPPISILVITFAMAARKTSIWFCPTTWAIWWKSPMVSSRRYRAGSVHPHAGAKELQ